MPTRTWTRWISIGPPERDRNNSMYILIALVAGSAIYSLLSIFAALRFLSTRRPKSSAMEPISILKPLA